MGVLVGIVNIGSVWSVSRKDVPRYVYDELYSNGHFLPALPSLNKLFVLLVEVLRVLAHEETCDMVVIFGGIEWLERHEIFLDTLDNLRTGFLLKIKHFFGLNMMLLLGEIGLGF